jgi:hypothetical protein
MTSPGGMLATLARGIGLGAAGTGAMTLVAAAHAWARGGPLGFVEGHETMDAVDIVDFDSSAYVPLAAATLLRLPPLTPERRRALFYLVHWGYGSAVGLCYPPLALRFGRRKAAVTMLVGTQAMAFTLFPLLGGTPPPWRWRLDQILTSLVQHAIYTGGVAGAAWLLPSP